VSTFSKHRDAPGPGPQRAFALVAGASQFAALAAQLYLIVHNVTDDGGSAWTAVWRFFSFFTILTNAMVCAAWLAPFLLPGFGLSRLVALPRVVTGFTASIVLVGIGYSLLLRHVWNPTGLQKIVDVALHDATPVLFFVYWLVWIPKRSIQWRDVLWWMAYPLVYLAYAVTLGAATGWFAYYFLDFRAVGIAHVAVMSAGLSLGFVAIGVGLVAIARIVSSARSAPSA